MVDILVLKDQEYMEKNKKLIMQDFGDEILVNIDAYVERNFNIYYTFDINKAVSMNHEHLNIFIYDGEYELSTNILCKRIEICGVNYAGPNKPKIKINKNIEIITSHLTFKNIEFTYQNYETNHYFNKTRMSQSVLFVLCDKYLKISNCVLDGKYDHTYSTYTAFIHLDKKWCEVIKIHKNIFNNSYLYFEFGMFSSINKNLFTNCQLDNRMSNVHVHNNKFEGKTRLLFFNDYKCCLLNNDFNNVENDMHIIKVDYNSNINIFNNNFKLKGNNTD